MKRMHDKQRGFSILEVLAVAIIFSITATIALPVGKTMITRMYLKRTADAIKNQLLTAKIRAVSDPTMHCGVYFAIDSIPQSTRLFFDQIGSGTPYQYDIGTDATYLNKIEIPPQITLRLPGSGAVMNQVVVFRGDGSAKNGGTIELVDNKGTVLQINVLASTGRIEVR